MAWWPFSNAGAGAGAGAGTEAKAKAQAQSQSQPQIPSQLAPQLQPQAALSGSVPHAIPHNQAAASSPPSGPDAAPHDPDFYAAHPHLAPPSFSTTQDNTTSQPAASNDSDSELDPHLPRTMSCRAAFDSAFYCSSLGGHFNDIYRYGQLRSCSDHWNDFWFCMRVKNSYSGRDVKERMVQERYREKEDKLRNGPSSEDVWRLRGEDERVVGAFGMGKKDEQR